MGLNLANAIVSGDFCNSNVHCVQCDPYVISDDDESEDLIRKERNNSNIENRFNNAKESLAKRPLRVNVSGRGNL